MPEISAVEMKGLCTIGEFNSGSVCKEDAFRGRVHFAAQYSFSNESILEPAAARKAASALISRILERFDSMLVRCGGTGWRTKDVQERHYTVKLMCRTTGVNKSPTGRRKGKKEDGTRYMRRDEKVAEAAEAIPCCARVRHTTAHYLWAPPYVRELRRSNMTYLSRRL